MSIAGYIESQFLVPTGVEVSATNNGGGPTVVSLTSGTYTLTTLCAHLAARLNAVRAGSGGATWSVTPSLSGTAPTGKVTIAMSASTYSIAWSSTTLRTMLGFDANITSQSTSTGANAARGIWIPDATLDLEGDPRVMPTVTDLRTTMSPTGQMFGLVGNQRYRHRALVWGGVERHRVWAADPSVPSWEQFLFDVHFGQGHSWFTPASRVRIVDHTGQAIGSDVGEVTWQMLGVTGVEPKKTASSWTGIWTIEIPEIVAVGS